MPACLVLNSPPVLAHVRGQEVGTKTDPIVRVEAARLRERLRDYYNGHGRADEVLISVPRDG